ncbi:TraX family protein [Pseudomonas putida S11]|nr:TraX family protein [Pseudomonas putida S11]
MRSAGLDLVKWTAMLTMVADHLRFLWPDADGLFVVGRLAFPLFCLAIAVNVARTRCVTLYTRGNLRYLGLMLVFAVLSEPAYRWLDSGSPTFSVMPTLVLGLLVAWGVHHPLISARVLGFAGLLAGWLFSEQLMYGLPGVMLPSAWLMARAQGRGGLGVALPVGHGGEPDQQLVAGTSVGAHYRADADCCSLGHSGRIAVAAS